MNSHEQERTNEEIASEIFKYKDAKGWKLKVIEALNAKDSLLAEKQAECDHHIDVAGHLEMELWDAKRIITKQTEALFQIIQLASEHELSESNMRLIERVARKGVEL